MLIEGLLRIILANTYFAPCQRCHIISFDPQNVPNVRHLYSYFTEEETEVQRGYWPAPNHTARMNQGRAGFKCAGCKALGSPPPTEGT